jgi:quinone-modifying oxidoreductase subunit QmoA
MAMTDREPTHVDRADVLVIGGGIAGITTAVEAAEAGCDVLLVERAPTLGGRVARMHQYFPKMCPPSCGLEINYRRLKQNPRVTVLTMAEVASIAGAPGDYTVTLRMAARHVTDACTMCGECAKVCPGSREDEFNYGLARTKAAYLPCAFAFPARYVIDRAACEADCTACRDACAYGAIDLDQRADSRAAHVSAIVAATGWAPYDASRIDNLGFGRCANVITNVMMERYAAADGPTAGRIVRPSDGASPKTVAFVQCAGSRDENHLPHCSAVCCAASLKQATYVRSACPDAAVKIFYIDIRTGGRLESLHAKIAADPAVELVKGKVARVEEDPVTKEVLLEVEAVTDAVIRRERADLVVLATGLVPQTAGLPAGFSLDESGFAIQTGHRTGLYATGCVRRPAEVSATVQDATGAALRALQCAKRSGRHD